MEYLQGNIELPNEKEEKKMFQRARGYITPRESCSSQVSPAHG